MVKVLSVRIEMGSNNTYVRCRDLNQHRSEVILPREEVKLSRAKPLLSQTIQLETAVGPKS